MKLFLLFTFGTINFFSVYAQQDSSGVYLTASDFKNRHLVYAINCKTQKHKIKLKSFFSKPYIVVVHNDSSYTLQKSEVYGYKDCDENVYRFVDQKVYTILNPEDPIVLYRYFVYIPKDPINDYFFSVGSDGDVIELTKTNLKETFPDNHRFHMLIDETYKDDLDLISYSKKSKAYRLLATYSASLK
jgi:hypothetical protein